MNGSADPNNPLPLPLVGGLGVQRDGTRYRAKAFLKAQWTRFFNGYPEKVGGYEMLALGNNEIVSNMYAVSQSTGTDVYVGRPSSLHYFSISSDNRATPEVSRTPTVGFTPNLNNTWSFATVSENETTSYLFTLVTPNRNNINGQTNGPLFYGSLSNNSPFIPIYGSEGTQIEASGGVVSLSLQTGRLIVVYGNNGTVRWNDQLTLDSWPIENVQVIARSKIVAAIEYFGSILFWTADGSLIRATFNPALTPVAGFSLQVIMNNISLMSVQSIVQCNQLIFWIGGNGQFYVFNGTVARVNNYMNAKWFFDNIDQNYQSKCFGIYIPKYDEIWYFYPRLDRSVPEPSPQRECNAVIVYTVSREIWHDLELDRSAAVMLSQTSSPIMASSLLFKTYSSPSLFQTYPIWIHEKGVDQILLDGTRAAIEAYFEFPIFSLFAQSPSAASNRLVNSIRLEPDFIINGEMTFILNFQDYPQGKIYTSGPYTFDLTTPYVDVDVSSSQGRLVSVYFNSNVLGGYFEAGIPIHDLIPGDFNPRNKPNG